MTAKKPKTAAKVKAKPKDKFVIPRDWKVKPTKVKPTEPPNKLFPGRDNYVGPQTGIFAMLHHQQLFEEVGKFHAVRTRVEYVKSQKPEVEKPVRLHNMMYLGGCPYVKTYLALQKVNAMAAEHGYEFRRPIDQAFEATKRHLRPFVIAYIKAYIPDHSWDEANNTIKGTN